MYCSNCGTQMSDDSLFCPNCGARRDDAPEPSSVFPEQNETPDPVFAPEPTALKKKLSKGALIGIIAGAAAVVVAAVLLIVLLGGGSSSWKSVVEKALNADLNSNVSDMMEACMPDEVLNTLLEEHGMTKSEYRQLLKDLQAEYDVYMKDESYQEYLKSVKFEVDGSEPLDADEVYELNRYYYRNFGTPMDYISEALSAHVSYSNGYTSDGSLELDVVNIHGSWYISLADNIGLVEEIFD